MSKTRSARRRVLPRTAAFLLALVMMGSALSPAIFAGANADANAIADTMPVVLTGGDFGLDYEDESVHGGWSQFETEEETEEKVETPVIDDESNKNTEEKDSDEKTEDDDDEEAEEEDTEDEKKEEKNSAAPALPTGPTARFHPAIGFVAESEVVITFNVNGGNEEFWGEVARAGIPGSPLANWPGAPEGLGFAFWHWLCEDGMLFDKDTLVPDRDIEVFAQWGFDVQFFGNGYGVPNEFAIIVVGPGMTAENSPHTNWPENPTRPGAEFVGWYTTQQGGTRFTEGTPITSRPLLLYARWQTPPIHTVNFNVNGGTERTGYRYTREFHSNNSTDVQDTYAVHQSILAAWMGWRLNADTSVTLERLNQGTNEQPVPQIWGASAPPAERDDATLEGWWTSADGWETIRSTDDPESAPGRWAHPGREASDPFTPPILITDTSSEDFGTGPAGNAPLMTWVDDEQSVHTGEVFANWVWRVTFDPASGTLAPINTIRDFPITDGGSAVALGRFFLPNQANDAEAGTWSELGLPPAPYRTNFRFDGWEIVGGPNDGKVFGADSVVTESMAVRAIWTPEDTVNFGTVPSITFMTGPNTSRIEVGGTISATYVRDGETVNLANGGRVARGTLITFTFTPHASTDAVLHPFGGWRFSDTSSATEPLLTFTHTFVSPFNTPQTFTANVAINAIPWRSFGIGVTIPAGMTGQRPIVDAVATLPNGQTRNLGSTVTGNSPTVTLPEGSDVVIALRPINQSGYRLAHWTSGTTATNGVLIPGSGGVNPLDRRVPAANMHIRAVIERLPSFVVSFHSRPGLVGNVTAWVVDENGNPVLDADGKRIYIESGDPVQPGTRLSFRTDRNPNFDGYYEPFYGWTVNNAAQLDNDCYDPNDESWASNASHFLNNIAINADTTVIAWYEWNPFVNRDGRIPHGRVTFGTALGRLEEGQARPTIIPNDRVTDSRISVSTRMNFPWADADDWQTVTSGQVIPARSQVKFTLSNWQVQETYRLLGWQIGISRVDDPLVPNPVRPEDEHLFNTFVPYGHADFLNPIIRDLMLLGRFSNLDVTAVFARDLFFIDARAVLNNAANNAAHNPSVGIFNIALRHDNLPTGHSRTFEANPATPQLHRFDRWQVQNINGTWVDIADANNNGRFVIDGNRITVTVIDSSINIRAVFVAFATRNITVQILDHLSPTSISGSMANNQNTFTRNGNTVWREFFTVGQGQEVRVEVTVISANWNFVGWQLTVGAGATLRIDYDACPDGRIAYVTPGTNNVTVRAVFVPHTVEFRANGGYWSISATNDGTLRWAQHVTNAGVTPHLVQSSTVQTRRVIHDGSLNAGTSANDGTAMGILNGMPRVIDNPATGPNGEIMVFAGWFTAEDMPSHNNFVTPSFTSTTAVTGDMVLYARWLPANIVTFDGTGRTNEGDALFLDNFHELPVAAGFTTAQMNSIWFGSFADSGTSASGINLRFNNQRYNIYHSNWGVARSAAPDTILAQWPDNNRPSDTATGGRWALTQEGLGTRADYFHGGFVVEEDMTVYAQWLVNVEFHSNRRSIGNPNIQELQPRAFTSQYTTLNHLNSRIAVGRSFNNNHYHLATSNASVAPTSNAASTFPTAANWNGLAMPGWVLAGWSTCPDDSEDGIRFNESTVLTWDLLRDAALTSSQDGDKTTLRLYAVWTQQIAFDAGARPYALEPGFRERNFDYLTGFLINSNPDSPNYGKPDPFYLPPDPVWYDHDFLGWSSIRTGPATLITRELQLGNVAGAEPVRFTQPTTYFARWSALLTFDGNGGTLDPNGVHTHNGHALRILGEAPFVGPSSVGTTPTRQGFTFAGTWNACPDGSGMSVYPGSQMPGNITAFAQWIPITWDVSFEARRPGGQFNSTPEQFIINDDVDFNFEAMVSEFADFSSFVFGRVLEIGFVRQGEDIYWVALEDLDANLGLTPGPAGQSFRMPYLPNFVEANGVMGTVTGLVIAAEFGYEMVNITTAILPRDTAGSVIPESGRIRVGSTQELTATAADGWKFVEWYSVTGAADHSDLKNSILTVTAGTNNIHAIALFEIIEFKLATEVDPDGSGIITEYDDDVDDFNGVNFETKLVIGQEVILRATPSAGWQFVEWDVIWDDDSNAGSVEKSGEIITIFGGASSVRVIARLRQEFTLTTDLLPATYAGHVSPVNSTVFTGETHSVVAIASPGWRFVEWVEITGAASYDIVSQNANGSTLTVVVGEENIHVVARFEPRFVLTSQVLPGNHAGSINPSSRTIFPGETHTAVATAALGWHFVEWVEITGAASYIISGNTVTVITGSANVHVVARFAPNAVIPPDEVEPPDVVNPPPPTVVTPPEITAPPVITTPPEITAPPETLVTGEVEGPGGVWQGPGLTQEEQGAEEGPDESPGLPWEGPGFPWQSGVNPVTGDNWNFSGIAASAAGLALSLGAFFFIAKRMKKEDGAA